MTRIWSLITYDTLTILSNKTKIFTKATKIHLVNYSFPCTIFPELTVSGIEIQKTFFWKKHKVTSYAFCATKAQSFQISLNDVDDLTIPEEGVAFYTDSWTRLLYIFFSFLWSAEKMSPRILNTKWIKEENSGNTRDFFWKRALRDILIKMRN